MKSTLLLSVCAVIGLTFSAVGQTTKVMTALSSFGTRNDGTMQPGDVSFITSTSYQRGLSYNPATGNLVFIDREAGGNGTNAITGQIYILNGTTGASITTLNTNGMGGGTFADCATGVSDDGVIYVANMANSAAATPFVIYRWDSEASTSAPIVVYSGDPAPGLTPRWGETLDIRGSGANTQIIIGSKTQTMPGTNVVIFTASDNTATNFVAHLINTDIPASEAGTSSEPGMGVAFGSGNSFWTKHKGSAPLRHLNFDLTSNTASSVQVFGTNVFPASTSLSPLAVDAANNLLAIVDVSSPNTVRLYSIADLSKPPVLLDTKPFPTANANVTIAVAYLDFGGGNLYVHDINNGIMAMTVTSTSLSAPTFITQPSGTVRLPEGRNVGFETLAAQATSYQWQKNGVNITGATGAELYLSNLLTSDTGSYSVIASNAAGTSASSSVFVNVVSVGNLFRLSPLWVSAVNSGNTLNPAGTNYINQNGSATVPNQRTIAYNALSNQLFVVSRTNSSSVNFAIYVINATNGQYQYNLKTNGISGGSIGLVGIACADDGAVYACNEDTSGSGTAVWKLYRWADSGPNTLPVNVFSGEPTGQSGTPFRWGDVLTVRGSGTSTEVIIDNQNSTARYAAVVKPTDSTMATFTSTYQNLANNAGGTIIGRSLQWGTNNSDGTYNMWQKRKGAALVQSTFDPNSAGGLASVVASYTSFPSTLGAVALDLSRNLAVGLDFNGNASTPDSVALYDVTDLTAPLFINRYNFSVVQAANNNFIGQVLLTSNYVFALDANNGLMAFTVSSGPPTPPTILSQSGNARLVTGQNLSLFVSSPDATAYQWRRNGSNINGATSSILSITNVQVSNAGLYSAVLTNSGGATTSAAINVSIISASSVYQLAPAWSYTPGTNGTGAFTNYVTYNGGSGTPNERTMAYNPALNELYIVQRNGNDYAIHVIDGTTGTDLRTLNTNGLVFTGTAISGQNYVGLGAIGVGTDGSIYASCIAPDSSSATGLFRLFRWADSSTNSVPVEVFNGDPAGQTSLRWGDVMDVRGGGLSTEIVMNNNQGTFGAVLRPSDASMTTFLSYYFSESSGSAPIGRSLQFLGGSTNEIWQKRSTGDLQLTGYDLASNTSVVETNYNVFPTTMGPVAIDTARRLLVGINFSTSTSSPDTVDMYDVTDPITPILLLSRQNFPINHQGNQNFIGQVILSGNKVFALSGNNGLVALNLTSPFVPAASISVANGNVTISWTNSATGFTLQSSPLLFSPSWTDVNATVTSNNGQNTVTVPVSGATQFYRLRK